MEYYQEIEYEVEEDQEEQADDNDNQRQLLTKPSTKQSLKAKMIELAEL